MNEESGDLVRCHQRKIKREGCNGGLLYTPSRLITFRWSLRRWMCLYTMNVLHDVVPAEINSLTDAACLDTVVVVVVLS